MSDVSGISVAERDIQSLSQLITTIENKQSEFLSIEAFLRRGWKGLSREEIEARIQGFIEGLSEKSENARIDIKLSQNTQFTLQRLSDIKARSENLERIKNIYENLSDKSTSYARGLKERIERSEKTIERMKKNVSKKGLREIQRARRSQERSREKYEKIRGKFEPKQREIQSLQTQIVSLEDEISFQKRSLLATESVTGRLEINRLITELNAQKTNAERKMSQLEVRYNFGGADYQRYQEAKKEYESATKYAESLGLTLEDKYLDAGIEGTSKILKVSEPSAIRANANFETHKASVQTTFAELEAKTSELKIQENYLLALKSIPSPSTSDQTKINTAEGKVQTLKSEKETLEKKLKKEVIKILSEEAENLKTAKTEKQKSKTKLENLNARLEIFRGILNNPSATTTQKSEAQNEINTITSEVQTTQGELNKASQIAKEKEYLLGLMFKNKPFRLYAQSLEEIGEEMKLIRLSELTTKQRQNAQQTINDFEKTYANKLDSVKKLKKEVQAKKEELEKKNLEIENIKIDIAAASAAKKPALEKQKQELEIEKRNKQNELKNLRKKLLKAKKEVLKSYDDDEFKKAETAYKKKEVEVKKSENKKSLLESQIADLEVSDPSNPDLASKKLELSELKTDLQSIKTDLESFKQAFETAKQKRNIIVEHLDIPAEKISEGKNHKFKTPQGFLKALAKSFNGVELSSESDLKIKIDIPTNSIWKKNRGKFG